MKKGIILLGLLLSVLLQPGAYAQSVPRIIQEVSPAEALLIKARGLYDAPFQHGLISFDCAVDVDWSKHFSDLLGSVPPAAVPTIRRLQSIQHRVFVDRSGATLSAVPKTPNLVGVLKGQELEAILKIMATQGINAWIPASTDVILPRGSTTYNFQHLPGGYKLEMQGDNLQVQLLLDKDLSITSGVVEKPSPMRMQTVFESAPNGLVLTSLQTSDTSDPAAAGRATFTYTYQAVSGIQLPKVISVLAAEGDRWTYSLSDCKVVKGIVVEVAPSSR